MCRSLKSNVQANGLYKRPQLLRLQLDTYNEGGVVMTSAQVAEQIKSISHYSTYKVGPQGLSLIYVAPRSLLCRLICYILKKESP